MRALSTAALLEVWERGSGQSLFQRALILLAAASPDTSPDDLARLPIGQRDGRLLTLRELTFGPRVTGVAECARCRARLEFDFDTADTRAAVSDAGDPASQTFAIAVDDVAVRYRLPNSLDLAAVVLAIDRGGAAVPVQSAPPALLDAVVTHMGQSDPQGDLQLTFNCPSCADQREIAFDVASFFWTEIEAWASRTFRDVHALASAYGWREADILAMSPWRREQYLDLVRS
jgi:hypothetical protein